MTADTTRRAWLCSIDSQAQAKKITAALDAHARQDYLQSVGVDFIQLRNGSRIDIATNPGGLLAALDQAKGARK